VDGQSAISQSLGGESSPDTQERGRGEREERNKHIDAPRREGADRIWTHKCAEGEMQISEKGGDGGE